MTHDVRSSCLSVECILLAALLHDRRQSCEALCAKQDGGARRDRTDDLKLAKLALSQLSYGPDPERSSHLALRVETGGPGTS